MKKTRHFFNLLEIALAMAVIAIGLSGVMSLYALGAKTHQAAIADNQVANIAEYFFAYLKAQITKNSTIENENFNLPENYVKLIGSNSLPDHIKNVNNIQKEDLTLTNTNWTQTPNDEQIYKHNTHTGVFLYQQKTGDNVDFSALIFVYEDNIDNISLKRATETLNQWQTFTNSDLFKPYAKSICIDISYPAELSWESRKTITFKTEIFNEKFKLIK